MSRQDKATTERNTKMLREFVKRPENKTCCDCKRNDPRWASWNLGVYLCIRCSGIHRSMGTHISKVKSIDLDTWTPEQMQSIEKWGNRRANLYWEAHLKSGHIPPDHKMDSFIRSKYETRRWALDGPPPSDPSVLDSSEPSSSDPPAAPAPVQQQAAATTTTTRATATATPPITRQPQPHQLLSTAMRTGPQAPILAPPGGSAPPQPQPHAQTQPQVPAPKEDDLFSLDFHAPPPPSAPSQPKTAKQDILSLFSSPPPASAGNNAFGQFQSSSSAGAGWATQQQPQQQGWPQPQQQQQQPASAWGTPAAVAWGAPAPAPAPSSSANMWGTPATSGPAPTQDLFGGGTDIWGSSAGAGGGMGNVWGTSGGTGQKKDDAFGDIWGGFK